MGFKNYITILILMVAAIANGQNAIPHILRQKLSGAKNDSARYELTYNLLNYYYELNRDSSLFFANQNILIAQRNGKRISEAIALNSKGYQLVHLGRYAESLPIFLNAFRISEDPKNDNNGWILQDIGLASINRHYTLSTTHNMFGLLMRGTHNTVQEIYHFKESIRIATEINHKGRLVTGYLNLGRAYKDIHKLDSALLNTKQAVRIALLSGQKRYLSIAYSILGDIYYKKGDVFNSLHSYYEGIVSGIREINKNGLARNYFGLTNHYITINNKDSSLYYARKSFEALKSLGSAAGIENSIGIALENLFKSFKLSNQIDSTLAYARLALVVKDSINKSRIASLADFQNLSFREQLRLKALMQERIVYQSKVRTYALLAGLGIFLLIAIILYKNNRQKQKVNKVLELTLNNLKNTQSQLIQSAKMASLGELTAGIAHEIQNPLNFVNNFSEVNTELIDELNEEADSGNLAEVKAIAKDIKENEQKINQHGKRADAIVKGMLEHSRISSGVKELTDINTLADEYLRLAYHGLRAKDKAFNSKMKTDFDNSIGNINIIPQDIGRVVLNLLTNAFYAVNEKKKQSSNDYEPTVTIATTSIHPPLGERSIQIKVTDNGAGIPQKIVDKIFQPFFTTKPTGQGTGLGLSLSYDIVKAHGGEIKAETKEGAGSEFIIQLPI